MKMLLLVSLFFSLQASSQALQEVDSIPGRASNYSIQQNYLKKSKTQKTAAFLTLGGGVCLFFLGGAIGGSDLSNRISNALNNPNRPGYSYSRDDAASVFALIGLGSMISSVPLFIASSRNKRKAKAVDLSLKTENYEQLFQQVLRQTNYPALSVRIKL